MWRDAAKLKPNVAYQQPDKEGCYMKPKSEIVEWKVLFIQYGKAPNHNRERYKVDSRNHPHAMKVAVS
jgi:hypothetical protein